MVNPLYLIPLFVLLLAWRGRWIVYQNEAYQLKAIWFCWRTKQPANVLAEMFEVWPASHMLLEMWRWDYRRYVIHHDHFDAMEEFIVTELERNDITMELFKQARDESKKPEDFSNN